MIIAHLIEKEIQRREQALYKSAIAIEEDEALNNEMKEWDVIETDGLNE